MPESKSGALPLGDIPISVRRMVDTRGIISWATRFCNPFLPDSGDFSKGKRQVFTWRLVLALPIFPASYPASIVGASELNFCVRDGNRWTLTAINTNSVRWLCTTSMSKAFASNGFWIIAPFLALVKEILVTRTGFEPMLKA